MHIKEDARQIAQLAGSEVCCKRRTQTVTRSWGKEAYTQQIVTELYGISQLNTSAAYRPPGHAEDQNKKSFIPNPINAIVITQWENHNCGWDKSRVFVTNMDVSQDLFLAFDAYDERSIIENSLFRQTKQSLHHKYPIQKTKEGMHLFSPYIENSEFSRFRVEDSRH
ncbi:MAG: hypothetical protein AB1611_05910 [bacterium]